jgi:HAD superfamily hydrolase (TIGR01509 family)
LASPIAPCLAIFDHDGVLVDSFELHLESWLELGRRNGLPFTREFLHDTFGMTNPTIFRRLLGSAVPSEAEIAQFGEIKEECYREAARDHLTLMPGVREMIDALSEQGVRLAVGSSAPRANLELTFEVCGLAGRFDAIASLEDITHGKPDPEVFLVAARKAGVAPARSLVLEDAVVGVQAAKAAGMLAVGVGTTRPLPELLRAGADLAVANLLGFPTRVWVERLRQG